MKKDMNFFSQFSGKRKGQDGSEIYVYLLGGIVLMGIIVISLYYSISIVFTNKSITDYETKLNDPEVVAKIAESDKVNVKIDALTRYDKDLSIIVYEVEGRDAVTTALIEKIAKAQSPAVGVKIAQLTINSKEVNMSAAAPDRVAIAEFQHNLSNIDQVQSVYIGSIAGEGQLTFDVKCVLKDVD